MSSILVIPPGQNPPYAVVTAEDHMAWIAIATAIGVPWVLMFGAVRIFVRRTVRLGPDDILVGIATVRPPRLFGDCLWHPHDAHGAIQTFALLQTLLVLIACAHGLGRSVTLLSTENIREVEKVSKISKQ